MSFTQRINQCNGFDPGKFLPFEADGSVIGRIDRQRLGSLEVFPDLLEVGQEKVTLSPHLETTAARTAAMEKIVKGLIDGGHLSALRNEAFPVFSDPQNPDFTGHPLLTLDRCAVKFFGLPAWGLHLNGYIRARDGEIHIWVARRAMDRPVHPGLFDNMVAGGQPYAISVAENLLKESAEEAGLSAQVMKQARDVGTISYCVETPDGLSPATMFIFDLELPQNIIPTPVDGEIDEFILMPAREVARLTADTYEFKPNTCLVNIDFLLRHGIFEGPNEEKESLKALLRP